MAIFIKCHLTFESQTWNGFIQTKDISNNSKMLLSYLKYMCILLLFFNVYRAVEQNVSGLDNPLVVLVSELFLNMCGLYYEK
jgi:hypothetical protein